MGDIQQTESLVLDLVSQLNLVQGDEDSAFGEIHGTPAMLTVLGIDPLSLLFAFKVVSPHPEHFDPPDEIQRLIAEENAEVSLEDGFVWLSLYDLSSESSASIQVLIERFVAKLGEAELTVAPGCVSCGRLEDANIVYLEGKVSRLCPGCVQKLYEDREQAEEELNRPSVLHSLGLPLVFLLVAGGWMAFWLLVDLALEWLNTNVIEVNQFTGLLLMIVLCAVGFGLGYPIGTFLRRSGVVETSPRVVSVAAVVLALVGGEILFISVCVFRQIGIFDISMATDLFVPFIKSHHPSWIALKILVAGAIAFGAIFAATAKKTAQLQV